MTKVTRIVITIIGYGIATGVGILLYTACRPYAVELRGSHLYGGEVMLLGMPIYWAAIKTIVADVKAACKSTENALKKITAFKENNANVRN